MFSFLIFFFQDKGVASSLNSRESLAKIIQCLIWWATRSHAAVNYPLREHSTLVLQEPPAIYDNIDTFLEMSEEEQKKRQIEFLPPLKEAVVSKRQVYPSLVRKSSCLQRNAFSCFVQSSKDNLPSGTWFVCLGVRRYWPCFLLVIYHHQCRLLLSCLLIRKAWNSS